MEVEWGNTWSFQNSYWMPTTVKFTPLGTSTLWGKTEFSVNFDSVASLDSGSGRDTGFSDHVSIMATSLLYDGEKLNIAVAPEVIFLRRFDEGERIGAVAITRYDVGLNSAGIALTWTGATAVSPTNPAGTFDLSAGHARRIASSGKLSHLIPYFNLQLEKSTGQSRQWAVFEGFQWEFNGAVSLDLAGQHYNLGSGVADNQLAATLTVNFGRPRNWFQPRH